jgi:hypothetical protein
MADATAVAANVWGAPSGCQNRRHKMPVNLNRGRKLLNLDFTNNLYRTKATRRAAKRWTRDVWTI